MRANRLFYHLEGYGFFFGFIKSFEKRVEHISENVMTLIFWFILDLCLTYKMVQKF